MDNNSTEAPSNTTKDVRTGVGTNTSTGNAITTDTTTKTTTTTTTIPPTTANDHGGFHDTNDVDRREKNSDENNNNNNNNSNSNRNSNSNTNNELISVEWKKKREAKRKERELQQQQQQQHNMQLQDDFTKLFAEEDTTTTTTTTPSTGISSGNRMNTTTAKRNDDFDVDDTTNTISKRRKQFVDEDDGTLLLQQSTNNNHSSFVYSEMGRNGNNRNNIYNDQNTITKTTFVQDDHDNKNNTNNGDGRTTTNDSLANDGSGVVAVDDDNNENRNDKEDNHTHDTTTATNVESLIDSLTTIQQKQKQNKHIMSIEERAALARAVEEERIMKEATKMQTNALQAVHDLAQGVIYNEPMYTTWTPPTYIMQQGQDHWQSIRNQYHMHVQGDNIPPPIERFVDMKFPKPILQCLQTKHITKPTPIQIQGLPVALACRDMVGIAFTGSGKTLTFTLPLVMLALEEEMRMPIVPGEGPIGIILAPSRELARQTYDLITDFCNALSSSAGTANERYPQLHCQLLIGGESIREQSDSIKKHGVHCVVATPGRLRDILKRKVLNLSICRYICLDEADRMLDMGFDEEVREIMNYFVYQRQTLLFSATFPRKFQDFARQTLVKPIIVNVGRAGAANLDVIQEVEYVKEEAKIVYLLHCLQKTAPPVIIFCERKGSADDIHEYLLLKGVEAVSIHGGKDQEERNEAIHLFKTNQKDVLIATDIAAKGLDFPQIQHVINYDMPNEIENYVHRIGRTGRAGKTGVATTFINKNCDETTLLDLKALLKEAKQRIPPVLLMLEDPREQQQQQNTDGNVSTSGLGCSFCGGLGHTIIDCPKIDKDSRRVAGSHRDVLVTGGGNW